MKKRNCLAALAATFVLFTVNPAHAQIAYDAGASSGSQYFNPGVAFGDQIRLSTSESNPTITQFKFDYYLGAGSSGSVNFAIYYNDGANDIPGYSSKRPGTFVYNNSFSLSPGYNTINIQNLSLSLATNSFTWTASFSTQDAGLILYSSPSIGSNYNDYWENVSGVWKLKQIVSGGVTTTANFGAQVFVGTPNTPPSFAVFPQSKVLNVGERYTATVTATDAETPTSIRYSIANAPAGMTINANIGAIDWTPTAQQADQRFNITITATDGAASPLQTSQILTLSVNPLVNEPPAINVIDFFTVNELQTIAVAIIGNEDRQQRLDFTLINDPTGGAAQLTQDGRNAILIWTPLSSDGPGTYTFEVSATDNGEPALSGTTSFTIEVMNVNRPPVATHRIPNFSIQAFENTQLDLTSYFADPDGDALAFSIEGASGAFFDGSVLEWTPTQTGNFDCSVAASDGIMTVRINFRITVTAAPVANSPPGFLEAISNQTVDEGKLLVVTVTATDDPQQTLTYSLTQSPDGMIIDRNSGKISWTPAEYQQGSHVVAVRVVDNGDPPLDTLLTFPVTVNEVNSTPTLTIATAFNVKENVSLTGVQATALDSDIPQNTLTFSLVGAPSGMTINATSGLISWKPSFTQGGQTYRVTVRVTDNGVGALSASQEVSFVVEDVNQAPTLAIAGSPFTINELQSFSITPTAADPDAGTTLIYGFADPATVPVGMSINAANGLIQWTATEEQGPSTNNIAVYVKDSGLPPLSVTNNFRVVVNEVNTAPRLASIRNQSATVNQPFSYQVSATDNDKPANTITYTLTTAPPGMTINASSGVISWTPTASTTVNVTVRATDNGTPNLFDSLSFTVAVSAQPNRAPVANPDTMTVAGSSITIPFSTLLANDTDPDINTLNVTSVGNPTKGTTTKTDNSLVYTRTAGAYQVGTDSFTYAITDNAGGSATATVTLTLQAIPQAPVITRLQKNGQRNAQLEFTDSDTSVDLLTITASSSDQRVVANGDIRINGNGGSRAIVLNRLNTGTATITVTVTDPGGLFATSTITVAAASITGTVIAGYIAGGTVFFDANLNGIKDANEPSTTTDANGLFNLDVDMSVFDLNGNGQIDANEGKIVMTGGTDIATGKSLSTLLSAPAGSTTVTPLTTLVAEVMASNPSLPVAAAQEKVLVALDLPKQIDLRTYDPIKAAAAGDPSAIDVLKADYQIQATTVAASSLIDAANPKITATEAAAQVTAAIVQKISKQEAVDLTSSATVKAVVEAAATTTATVLAADVTQGAASMVSQVNTEKQKIASSDISAAAALEQMTRVQVVAENTLSADLGKVGQGTKNIEDAVAANTGANLQEAITQAPVGDITATESRPGSFSFSKSTYKIQENGQPLTGEALVIKRDDGNVGAVNLVITLSDGTAKFASGDYKAQTIPVVFADAELLKAIDLTQVLNDDNQVAGDKTINLALSLASGAPATAKVGTQGTAILTKMENDTPGKFTLTANAYTLKEDRSSPVGVVVSRSEGSAGTVNLTVTMVEVAGGAKAGVNYTPGPISVTFAPGQLNQRVYIPFNRDYVHTGPLALKIGLAIGTNPPLGTALGAITAANITMDDIDGNQAPIISLAIPAGGPDFLAPANVQFQAPASDADGQISLVEFYAGAKKIGQVINAPYSFTWNDAPAGSFVITAVATDNEGTTTVSNSRRIRIGSNINSSGLKPNGLFGLNFTGEPGTVYLVEGTSDFVNWKPVLTVTSTGLGRLQYTDTATLTSKYAFYRVVDNRNPKITLDKPVIVGNAIAPAVVTLKATPAAATGSSVQVVEYFIDGAKVGESSTDPYTIQVSGVTAGLHAITARVTDDKLLTRLSSAQSIQIFAAITGLTRSTTGQTLITIAGEVGRGYRMFGSSDGKTWSILGTVTIGSDGYGTFTDPDNLKQRFYRAQRL